VERSRGAVLVCSSVVLVVAKISECGKPGFDASPPPPPLVRPVGASQVHRALTRLDAPEGSVAMFRTPDMRGEFDGTGGARVDGGRVNSTVSEGLSGYTSGDGLALPSASDEDGRVSPSKLSKDTGELPWAGPMSGNDDDGGGGHLRAGGSTSFRESRRVSSESGRDSRAPTPSSTFSVSV